MTTFELRDYRRQLESAIAFFGRQAPVPPARARLGRALDEVLAEQAERARSAADTRNGTGQTRAAGVRS